MLLYSPDTRTNKSSSHHLFNVYLFFKFFSFLKLSRESLTSSCKKKKKKRKSLERRSQAAPFQTRPTDYVYGDYIWEQKLYAHTYTHTGATRSHNTSFSDASIKPHWLVPFPLLSICHAEMFTFTYKWPGVMLCHKMFHGQITRPISQSALQLLSPLVASIATPKNHDCRKRRTLCRCSEMPPWITALGSGGNLKQPWTMHGSFGAKLWQTWSKAEQLWSHFQTFLLSVLGRSDLMVCCQ